MKKEYQIKVYTKANVYIETIEPIDIISNISFSNNINSWQWNITLKINKSFNTTTYTQWNIVKISLFNTTFPTWKQVYLWFINEIKRIQTVTSQYIELWCVWIFWLLNNIIFDNGWKAFTINDEPADTIKLIIDYFNTQYTGWILSYSWWNISNYWSNVNISFNYDNCFEAIKKVVWATNFRWYINEDWQVYFKVKPVATSHSLINQNNVESVTIGDDSQDVVNKLYLERNWWTIVVYQDATSQSTYWIKEKKESQTSIQDIWTQNTRWNNYISQNKDSKKETNIVVNNKYDYENIMPWQTIKVININYTIDWLQVLWVNYSPQRATLTLEKKVSFWNQVIG